MFRRDAVCDEGALDYVCHRVVRVNASKQRNVNGGQATLIFGVGSEPFKYLNTTVLELPVVLAFKLLHDVVMAGMLYTAFFIYEFVDQCFLLE